MYMDMISRALSVYLLVINAIAFILYGIDKHKAIKGKWRVPEATLIGIAALGGALGALLGMLVWHHKTRKWKFRILVPLCLVVWVAIILFGLYGTFGKEEETMTSNIEVFTQSSIRITGSQGIIYVDTFRMSGEPKDADYIFITHDHYDHYSPEDIAKVLSNKTVIVVPGRLADTVEKDIKGYDRIVSVRPGDSLDVNGLQFETVPLV